MVIVSNNPKLWLASLAVSLGIFLIVLFTVILPSNDAANNAVKTGLQQSQQALNQAQQQLKKTGGGGSAQANQALTKAQKLTACLSAAGTDVSKVQACQAQFGP